MASLEKEPRLKVDTEMENWINAERRKKDPIFLKLTFIRQISFKIPPFTKEDLK